MVSTNWWGSPLSWRVGDVHCGAAEVLSALCCGIDVVVVVAVWLLLYATMCAVYAAFCVGVGVVVFFLMDLVLYHYEAISPRSKRLL